MASSSVEGPHLAKKVRPNGFESLDEVRGHVYGMEPNDRPNFPSNGRVQIYKWLDALTKDITPDMRAMLREWNLMGLAIHAKHYNNYFKNWPAMGALIELWHPQSHTFIFHTFEATILLEEVELFCGFKGMQVDEEELMATMIEQCNTREILGEFMLRPEHVNAMLAEGINLERMAKWTNTNLVKSKGG